MHAWLACALAAAIARLMNDTDLRARMGDRKSVV
jgi:hypothetical protein